MTTLIVIVQPTQPQFTTLGVKWHLKIIQTTFGSPATHLEPSPAYLRYLGATSCSFKPICSHLGAFPGIYSHFPLPSLFSTVFSTSSTKKLKCDQHCTTLICIFCFPNFLLWIKMLEIIFLEHMVKNEFLTFLDNFHCADDVPFDMSEQNLVLHFIYFAISQFFFFNTDSLKRHLRPLLVKKTVFW
jgi:hypothetical protein